MQLTPQSRLFVATAPVDCRPGIAGLAAGCRQALGDNPRRGALYVFRPRAAPAITLLFYEGQGLWRCTKRLSQGRFPWGPAAHGARAPVAAREFAILLWNGLPFQAQRAQEWRQRP